MTYMFYLIATLRPDQLWQAVFDFKLLFIDVNLRAATLSWLQIRSDR